MNILFVEIGDFSTHIQTATLVSFHLAGIVRQWYIYVNRLFTNCIAR
jgi:hypothetical protein